MQNVGVQKVLKRDFGLQEPNEFSKVFVRRGLKLLEGLANEKGEFLTGEKPLMCDMFLMPQLVWVKLNQVELEPYPKLLRVEQAMVRFNPLFDNF